MFTTFTKILVPLDGSEHSERVLAQVERLLLADDAEVLLCRVVERRSGEPEHETTTRREGSQVYLDRQVKQLEERGARTRGLLLEGDAAGAILDCVANESPDLVAMSTHGRSGITRLIRGSVAERVLRTCPVPLLLVSPENPAHPDRTAFKKILVPLDGSDRASEALPLAGGLAKLYHSELTLFHVSWIAPPATEVGSGVIPMPNPDLLDVGRKVLEDKAQPLRKAGLDVRIEAVFGAEIEAILAELERNAYDLVVMTTHARSGLDRWLLGSVAEGVLRAAPCPVLVKRIVPVEA